jgi:hypothetical protein
MRLACEEAVESAATKSAPSPRRADTSVGAPRLWDAR